MVHSGQMKSDPILGSRSNQTPMVSSLKITALRPGGYYIFPLGSDCCDGCPEGFIRAPAVVSSSRGMSGAPKPQQQVEPVHLHVVSSSSCAGWLLSVKSDGMTERVLQEHVIVSVRRDCYALAGRSHTLALMNPATIK